MSPARSHWITSVAVPSSAVRSAGKVNMVRPASRVSIRAMPARNRSSVWSFNGSFNVAVKDHTDDRLRAGIARMLTRLAGRTILTLPADLTADEGTATLVIQCERAGDIVPSLSENESYTLEVTDKQARLLAPTVVGALRGLETFLQLLHGDRDGYYLPGIKIQDEPRFPWRGLLIDVGRHYEPMEVLKRNLDAM